LKAQVYVVCNKTKLVGVLFEKEPNVPLLVVVYTTTQGTTAKWDSKLRAVKRQDEKHYAALYCPGPFQAWGSALQCRSITDMTFELLHSIK